jgi:hypothetical protein
MIVLTTRCRNARYDASFLKSSSSISSPSIVRDGAYEPHHDNIHIINDTAVMRSSFVAALVRWDMEGIEL